MPVKTTTTLTIAAPVRTAAASRVATIDTCNAGRQIDTGQAPTFLHTDDGSECDHGRAVPAGAIRARCPEHGAPLRSDWPTGGLRCVVGGLGCIEWSDVRPESGERVVTIGTGVYVPVEAAPANREKEAAYLAGYVSIPGARETEHRLLVPIEDDGTCSR